MSNAKHRSVEQAGPACQTSSILDLKKRPPSVHRNKLSASLLQKAVSKNIALRSVELRKRLRQTAMAQKTDSNRRSLSKIAWGRR